MGARCKAWACVSANCVSALLIVFLTCLYTTPGRGYMTFGPSDHLIIGSVKVDTWDKWAALISLIAVWSVTDVFIHTVGSPILGFTIYNPDKKNVTEFKKNELQILANVNGLSSSVKHVFGIIIAVSQIDMALTAILFSEATSIVTTRMLLNAKTFDTGLLEFSS